MMDIGSMDVSLMDVSLMGGASLAELLGGEN